MLKIINVIMAYFIAVIIIAVAIALTYHLPQLAAGNDMGTKLVVDMILVVIVAFVIFSSPLVVVLGLFAFFKKIQSPYYYAICGIFAVLLTLMFIPGLQGVKGDDASLWVPFVGIVAAAGAGYVFWFLSIRRPQPKINTTTNN